MASLPPLEPNYATALQLIDEAHAEDPRPAPGDATDNGKPIPFELDYAQKMTRWLAVREPNASPALQLACRAQHFRRWELPRTSHPATRAGYLTWRAKQKSLAASQLLTLLTTSPSIQPPLPSTTTQHIAALVRKEGLPRGGTNPTSTTTTTNPNPTTNSASSENPNPEEHKHKEEEESDESENETQILEDVACLVFLDDQLEKFEQESGVEEAKLVGILRKTWGKMSGRGREIARGMELGGRAGWLVGKALGVED